MPRSLNLGCRFGYSAAGVTPVVLQVAPRVDPDLVELERVHLGSPTWKVTGDLDFRDYTDLYGNPCRRLVLPPGQTTIEYRIDAEVPDEVDARDPDAPEIPAEHLPDDVLLYTLPSRFCESDKLSNVAWKLFGHKPSGTPKVAAVCSWAWSYLTYAGGTTNSTTSASDCYVSGKGVCRDYAHLMISMCRGLNIPARYAAGYLPDVDVTPNPTPMDFHAWTEIWLGDRWWVFDPRHDKQRKGRVKIGHGRDAADLPSATLFGSTFLTEFTVFAHEAKA